MASSLQSSQGRVGQLKAVSPVYLALFLLAHAALVEVLQGRARPPVSTAVQNPSPVPKSKSTPALPLGFFPPLVPRVVPGKGQLLAAPCFSELAPAVPHLLVSSGQRLGEAESSRRTLQALLRW